VIKVLYQLPSEILSAIIASFAIVGFLLLYCRRPLFVTPGRRYSVSCVSAAILWFMYLHFTWESEERLLENLTAGLLIFVGAIFSIFPFYSVLSWGFRIAMLIRLNEQNNPVSIDEWMRAYSGRDGDMRRFYYDRIALLEKLNLVRTSSDSARLTSAAGKRTGQLVRYLYSLFLARK
jgi:hypothetical protein